MITLAGNPAAPGSKNVSGSGGRLAEGHMIRFIDVYKEYDNGTKALKGVSMRIDDAPDAADAGHHFPGLPAH